jgi:hypothetical protein
MFLTVDINFQDVFQQFQHETKLSNIIILILKKLNLNRKRRTQKFKKGKRRSN